ncbi:hypothetical protein [Clostridium sp.]|uniref:hypothetical protein n=1 Tax=Clostridium sp. TaxID=1506 RepID=UPI0025BCF143|nr:hypothetical protein [Clostridium sp.]
MRFEFKPSENIISFREYLGYLMQTSPGIIIYRKTIFTSSVLVVFSIITCLLSHYYRYFTYVLTAIIGIFIFYFLVIWLITKLIKARKNKVIKNNNLYCDIESKFYFTIEDGYLIRENEFSNIKIQLSKIKYVKLLNHGLILSTENENVSLFIPIDILPITLEAFISFLKEKNNSIIVLEESKRLKRLSQKIYMIFGVTFILACIFSFFIGKYN